MLIAVLARFESFLCAVFRPGVSTPRGEADHPAPRYGREQSSAWSRLHAMTSPRFCPWETIFLTSNSNSGYKSCYDDLLFGVSNLPASTILHKVLYDSSLIAELQKSTHFTMPSTILTLSALVATAYGHGYLLTPLSRVGLNAEVSLIPSSPVKNLGQLTFFLGWS